MEFSVNNAKFRYAYDMMSCKQIPIRNGKIKLDLAPCAGRIIMFTEKKLGVMTLNSSSRVKQGEKFISQIKYDNGSGLIPVLFDIYDPAGKKLSISRSDVISNGNVKREWIIPVNAPLGRWKMVAKEFATGQDKTVYFDVTK